MIHQQADPTPGQLRRAKRREARKTEMLDAAMKIVTDEGIDHLTIGRLAKEVDAAVGALYRYFPGKGAVIVALQQRAIESFGEFMDSEVERARAAAASEAWERAEVLALVPVIAGLRAYRQFADTSPETFGLIDSMLSDPRPLLDDAEAEAIQTVLDPILNTAASTLDAAAEAGALDGGDTAARTHMVWGSLHGLSHFRKRDARIPDELSSTRLIDELIRSLLLGWGGSRSDVDAAFRRL